MNERTVTTVAGYPIKIWETRAEADSGITLAIEAPNEIHAAVFSAVSDWCRDLNSSVAGTARATRRGPRIEVETIGDLDSITGKLPKLYEELEHLEAGVGAGAYSTGIE